MYSKEKAIVISEYTIRHGRAAAKKEFKIKTASLDRALRRAKQNEVFTEERPYLVIPDTHAPYNHPDAIEFLKHVHETYGCREEVIHVGDLMDFHSMSRHVAEPDCLSPEEEYARAKEWVGELTAVFPKGHMVVGNHDAIPQRQMKEVSLAPSMLRPNNQLYGLPEGWEVHPLYYVIPEWDVLVEHGICSSGKFGAINSAVQKRCSYVQGHTHSNAGVMYTSNYNSTIFGLNVGWLGDERSLAIRYAKYSIKRGVLGCGIVWGQAQAEFVPMQSWS